MNEITDLETLLNTLSLEKPYFVFITGASGVGKTTLLKALKEKLFHLPFSFNFFDDIGVPTFEKMITKFGSGEKWQQTMVKEWIQKLRGIKDKKIVILEGSVNPELIISALENLTEKNYTLIYLHAEKTIRESRLILSRNQLELVNIDMGNWAEFLKVKTLELKGQIIETNAQDITISMQALLKIILEEIKEASLQNLWKEDFPML